jgi:hypothetical protein
MLLIFTNSIDTTTDLLLDRMPDVPVFRFNIDLWRDYTWQVGPEGFRIEDPTGRSCDSGSTLLVYQRKPIFLDYLDIPAGGCLEHWCREEVEAVWKDIYFDYCAQGRACLVYPGRGKRGKIRQLWLAKQFFPVPEWQVFRGRNGSGLSSPVAKALTQTPIGAGKLFFTKEVEAEQLDPGFPWFLQEKVCAQADVTVVYVEGELFAFQLDRQSFRGVDYRVHVTETLPWLPIELKPHEKTAIRAFMAETGYGFGRLDLLRRDGELVFLELNPNGQWAWLDEEGKHGLLKRVAGVIREHYMAAAARVEPVAATALR